MDTQLLLWINQHHTAFLDSFMILLTGKLVWIPLYAALLYAVWRNYSWRGLLAVAVMVGIGMFFTDWFNAHILRPQFARLRPNNPESSVFHLLHLVNDTRGGGYGFPSAHSANFWMLTFLMVHWFRNRMLTVAMCLVAMLVCYSRVYIGYHYPGDILGGLVYAAIIVAFMACMHIRYLQFKPAERPLHIWVPAATATATILLFIIIASQSI